MFLVTSSPPGGAGFGKGSCVPFLPRAALAVAAAVAVLATAGGSAARPQLSAGHPASSPRPVAEVASFGDSWSDAGIFGSPFGTAGGGSWSQLLAGQYGADQEPNRRVESAGETAVGGLDYAEGGAVVAPPAEAARDTPRDVPAQLQAFLAAHGGFRPGQLVTVWAGTNDILTGLTGPGGADRAQAQAAVVAAAHRDVAGLFTAVAAHPGDYGFTVVDGDACTNDGARCGSDDWKSPDAERTYAFAGYGHFTAATRELVADFVHDEAGRAWGW